MRHLLSIRRVLLASSLACGWQMLVPPLSRLQKYTATKSMRSARTHTLVLVSLHAVQLYYSLGSLLVLFWSA